MKPYVKHMTENASPRTQACDSQMRRAAALLTLMLVCSGPMLASASLAQLQEVIKTNSIPIQEDLLVAPLEQALIHAIDPGARILSATASNHVTCVSTSAVATVEHFPGNIMYCRITALDGEVAQKIQAGLDSSTNAPSAGVILDLRNAGGTDLADVDAVASLFVGPGEILYRIKDGADRTLEKHRTHGTSTTNIFEHPPCILLIGTNTLDASEILAASLVERHKIMLIGTKTSGLSALRESLPLPDGRSLHIATRWIEPFERPAFQGHGVEPHLHVLDTHKHSDHWQAPKSSPNRQRPLSPKAKLQHQLLGRIADDAVLSRAADLLLSLKALGHRHVADAHDKAPDRAQ